MPNRVIKESINESRGLTSCSVFAQDLYKRLITYADDYGRFNADPQIMIARLYPRELSVISQEDMIDGLVELAGIGKIGFYTSTARKEVYGAFPSWNEHQRLRESKKKAPDPTDTSVNDWYLRRFIPIDMKAAIIERDGFKCQICGKHIASITDAKKLVKLGTGMFHFDHIVPCSQGGRATLENLRLTCPTCNLTRPRSFDFDEILELAATCGNSPQPAANICNLRPESNPIQSNMNPTPNPHPNPTRARDGGGENGISDLRQYIGEPTPAQWEEVRDLLTALGDHAQELLAWAVKEACDHNAKSWAYVRKVLDNMIVRGVTTVEQAQALKEKKTGESGRPAKTVIAQQYSQRSYEGEEVNDLLDWIAEEREKEAGTA